MIRLNFSITLLIFICIFCFSVAAQTSTDIRAKFGVPLKETYQINPNLFLSIEYGEDNQVCSVTKLERNIKLQPVFRLKDERPSAEEKARESFDILFQSILQVAKWGKEVKDDKLILGHQQGNCINSYRAEYENVSVSSFGSVCGENSPFQSYVVEWKREQCKKVKENRIKPYYFWQ